MTDDCSQRIIEDTAPGFSLIRNGHHTMRGFHEEANGKQFGNAITG